VKWLCGNGFYIMVFTKWGSWKGPRGIGSFDSVLLGRYGWVWDLDRVASCRVIHSIVSRIAFLVREAIVARTI
jgi:hypothetical protein